MAGGAAAIWWSNDRLRARMVITKRGTVIGLTTQRTHRLGLPLIVMVTLLAVAIPRMIAAQPVTGLVAAWGFNEGAGPTAGDASGNVNTGTIAGATWSALGRYGSALTFDGVNDMVVVNSSASLNLTTAMTLSAWVYPTANQSGWRTILQREVDAYFLNASNSNGPRFPSGGGTFSGSVSFVSGSSALPVNTWTHVALTWDGAILRLWVNGAQVASAAQGGVLETNSSPLRIGGNVPYGEFFQGRLDEIRVYNRALVQSELQTDMATPVGGGSAPPDTTVPAVTITSPTATPTHTATATPLTLGGTASDNVGVTQVTWINDRGGSGTATGTTAWTAAGIPLLLGPNVLTLTARDAAGNTATDILTVTYAPPDTTVPAVTITSPTATPTHTATATPLTLGGTASDNVGVTQVTWINDRGGSGTATGTTAWTAPGIPLLLGPNVLTLTARDAAGNTATDILTVTYAPPDTTVPAVTITSPTATPTHTATATPLTLGGTASDNVGVTQVTWINDRGGSGTATGTTAWTAAGIPLLLGPNVLTLTARDAAGNTATDILTVTYAPPDTTVPAVTITSPTATPTHTATATPLTLGGTASDNVGVTQVTWINDRGGSGTATGTTAWTAPGIPLLLGPNVLTLTARDAAGNTATDILTVTYAPPDTTVPAVTITSPTATPTHTATATPLTLGGTASDNVGVTQVTWINDRGGSGTATGTTAWTAAGIPLLLGPNVLTLTARDAAGNTATDILTVTYAPPDTTVPAVTITSPTATPTHTATATPLTLGGTASDNVGVTQVTWINDRGGSGTATGTTAWTAAGIPLLLGPNVLTLTARDAAGNTATDILTVTYTPPDTIAGLVAAWGFNEGAGPTAGDASGNVNTGTIAGATWSALGRYGSALTFDGVNDMVVVNSSASLNLTTAMTLSAWVYPTANQSGWRTILQREVDAYFLNASNSNGPRFPSGGGTFSGSVSFVSGSSALPVNTWTHVALTWDGAILRLWVNGAQVASAAQGGVLETNSSPLRIGGNVPYGEFFQGRLDEIRVYNRALVQSELQTDMATPVGGGSAPPDTTVPAVTITSPTATPTHTATATPLALGGTASDNVGVTQVTWINDRGGSGTATGTTAWTAAGIPLLLGSNVLTLTARDAAGNTATDILTVTYAPSDTTVPAVTITSPTATPTHTATATPLALGGTASDNVGVTQVTWINDRGGSGTATGTTAWTAAGIPLLLGANVLTLTARDAAGNTATDILTVTYAPSDTTVPAVTITSPTATPTHTATATPLALGGTASDNVGVTQVTWINDRGGSGTATGTTAWTAAGIPLLLGPNVLTLTARDAAGNTATDALTVTYTPGGGDPTAPIVSIASPEANDIVASTITVTALASDNLGVAGVQFFVDGVPIGAEDGSSPYSVLWDTSTVAPGVHTLTARARDAAGNTAISNGVPVNVRIATPVDIGQWSQPFGWPLVAVHATLLPTGRVLAWDGASQNGAAFLWNPANNTFTPRSQPDNIFCAGHTLLPDGRVLVVGGHIANFVGLRDASLFQPSTSTWSPIPPMSQGRWYPTAITLADGRALVLSGDIDCYGCSAEVPEVYTPATNQWTELTSAALALPQYPHLFVLPDGRVLLTSAFNDAVAARVLDVNTQTWTIVDPRPLDAHSAAMYRLGRVVKSGTSANSDPPYFSSSPNTYVLDMTAQVPAWRDTPPMAHARSYHNLTVLPDGTVLATGGSGVTDPFEQSEAAFPAELWSPESETWTTMAANQVVRVYHSTSLLLPDGRVLMAGGGRFGGGSADDQLTAEIYSPPYLFKGPRPLVTSAPTQVPYGFTFPVTTPDVSRIAAVSLIRLGSVTHGFDTGQRYLSLAFTSGTGQLDVQAPAAAGTAPPGDYMLFLLDTSGVPSVGTFLRVDRTSPRVSHKAWAAGGRGLLRHETWSGSTETSCRKVSRLRASSRLRKNQGSIDAACQSQE